LSGVAVMVALVGLLAGAGQANAADPVWKVAQTNTLPKEDGVRAMTVAPTTSTWSGGYQTVGGKEVPLVQHLLGSAGWTTVKTPSSVLGEVSAISASYSKNVWAFAENGKVDKAMHYNGKTWSVSTLPSYFIVTSAAAVSTNNVWAVSGNSESPLTYAEHWTGKAWHKVNLPAGANAISAVSASRIYAAGKYKGQPAVMHYDGKKWALAHTPKFPLPDQYAEATMRDILALSSDNVYAVGGMEWACGEDGDSSCSQPIILHWNGKAWSSTVLAKTYASFLRVTEDGAGGLWLLIGGWDPDFWHVVGNSVTHVTAPRPAGHDINITDLATVGSTIWAGGVAFPEGDPDDPTGNGLYLKTG
jgi:hypothetical protein